MSVNIDVSEETVKEVLKAAAIAVATLGTKYVFRALKFCYKYYQAKKMTEIKLTWGERIKDMVFAGFIGSVFFFIIAKLFL